MTAPLRTRKPTGRVAWPLILVEGEEKAGKTYVSLALSASDRIGRTFVFDLGDGTADEYAALGDFEVVDLSGSYSDLIEQIEAAIAVPAEDGRPNLYVVDSLTQEWDALKAWTDERARNSKAGKAKLKDDPDAEIDPSMNLWNDSKGRYHRILNLLRRAPGIAVVTAQGSEVAKVENGAPVAGQTVWSVNAEKTTAASVTAWVRMRRDPRSATLVGVRSLHVDVPTGGLKLPLERTLEHLVFEILGAGAEFGIPQTPTASAGIAVPKAKQRAREAALHRHAGVDPKDVGPRLAALWREFGLPDGREAEVTADQLADVLTRVASGDLFAEEAPESPDSTLDSPEEPVEPSASLTDPEEPSDAPGAPEDVDVAVPTLEEVEAMTKPDLVRLLGALGLSTAGKVEELRERVAGEFELLPEDAGMDGVDGAVA
jgi:hypothetical protein